MKKFSKKLAFIEFYPKDCATAMLNFQGQSSVKLPSTHFLLIIFAEEIKTFSKINRNTYKPSVPEEVKDIVRRNFTRELEFYDFCKQRLHKQYLALNLDKKP